MSGSGKAGGGSKPIAGSIAVGAAVGLLLAFPTVFAAIMSGGAGHGHYGAARLLFPMPMLLTLGDDSGVLTITTGLLQFPIYGALLGWCFARKIYLPAAALASLHVVAGIVCFAGTLPDFS